MSRAVSHEGHEHEGFAAVHSWRTRVSMNLPSSGHRVLLRGINRYGIRGSVMANLSRHSILP